MGLRKNITEKVSLIKDNLRETYNQLVDLQILIEEANKVLTADRSIPRLENDMIGSLEEYHKGSMYCQHTLKGIDAITDELKLRAIIRKSE